ncbi:hypothetical protein EHQ12_04140 [Leptospira gomenensis]|nr:hypothetical protein EHQ12_04140 [Leptospira gomenensis]
MSLGEYKAAKAERPKNRIGKMISPPWCAEFGIDPSHRSIALKSGHVRERDLRRIIEDHEAKAEASLQRWSRSYNRKRAEINKRLLEEYRKNGILIPDEKEKGK